MRKFDYSFLENQVPAKLLNLTALIYDIKGKESVRLNSNPKLFNKLKEKAIRDSIKGSNAIENIHTTEKRIDEIAAGDNKAFNHPEKEIIGYRNVLINIHTFYEKIIFDKTTILSLHKQLLDVAEGENRGRFKKEPNFISETKNGKKYGSWEIRNDTLIVKRDSMDVKIYKMKIDYNTLLLRDVKIYKMKFDNRTLLPSCDTTGSADNKDWVTQEMCLMRISKYDIIKPLN